MKIKKISPLEEDFTEVLERIALKPKTLYYRGKMPKDMVLDEKDRIISGVVGVSSSGETGLRLCSRKRVG